MQMSQQTSMYIFNIDRGGTFTDFYVQQVMHQKKSNKQQYQIVKQYCFKVPSQSQRGEGPVVGIKQFLKQTLDIKFQGKIPTSRILSIKLGTTIATNALLQRKGVNNVMVLSEGFEDLLQIREQTRPNIFDLSCTKPTVLTERKNCLSVSSRVYHQNLSELVGQLTYDEQNNCYIKEATEQELKQLIKQIQQRNPESIGISLCNSHLTQKAQRNIEEFLRSHGIKCPIQRGSKYIDLGYLKRTETANLDAYLNPILKKYFTSFQNQFEDSNVQIFFMKSDGGFTSKQEANASKMLLSGPAGGLIGYCEMAKDFQKIFKFSIKDLIGLDMGGTSTDVSKVKNRQFELKYSFCVEGLEICTPHLQIDTIAAGGGSKLGFRNGMLTVGPQSVGSNPGPVCYGIGEELALTDANLILNRLDPTFFPKVFGKNRDSIPDKQLVINSFNKLCDKLDAQQKKVSKQREIFSLAEGFIEIANQLMAKSARKILTLGKPDALVVFGSAGGQHCCDIAQKIGVNNILIHKFSGILSSYGLSKTPQTNQHKYYIGEKVSVQNFDFQKFKQKIPKFPQNLECLISEHVTIGYMGTGYSLKVPFNAKIFEQFEIRHKQQNGFTLPNKQYKIQSYIRTEIRYPQKIQQNSKIYEAESPQNYLIGESQVFMSGKFKNTKKYNLNGMKNCLIEGPVLILSKTSTIFVKQGWSAQIINQNMHISKNNNIKHQFDQTKFYHILQNNLINKQQIDPIKLTIYSTRFMGIAQQMGKVLQKTSISTNIRQRLDFSCGIFDWDGHLLANAPHLPVHLGSMETAVLQQIKRGIKPGDIILTNHPVAGGAHLPDLTVVSCFQLVKASRGHHADIGGITPGSMPPFSRTIFEQGVSIQKYELFQNGEFKQKQTRQLFKKSRRLDDNISDILAQIAANQIGIRLLKLFVRQNGFDQFYQYVGFICLNAKQCVEDLLYEFSIQRNAKQIQSVQSQEYMDDGTLLKLTLTINRNKKQAIFDFTGTGEQVVGNTNAPKSITRSAILYCLRCLIGQQIPLNSGCLVPIKIILPENSIINPSRDSAVVGGNVQTSQKLVDLIFKPFQKIAGSQGTMNNFLFGNEKYCYYQTICGGSGAGQNFDGKTIQCHMTNTKITDIEHLQKYYPVILNKFKKNQGSGGEGFKKGGDGVIRQFIFLQQLQISVLSQRRIFPAYGVKGGKPGEKGHNLLINRQGIIKNVGNKNCFTVNYGDRVIIKTPGGGGYGQKPIIKNDA